MAELLGSAPFASAYALTTIGALFSAHLLTSVIGTPGYTAVVAGLSVIGVAVLIVRRREIRLVQLMPTTLLVFLAWLLLTVFWSFAPGQTILGWIQLALPTLLAITIAHTRDTLQIVRATGDVLRVLLVGSLAVEVLSGILIDMPIRFLGIAGNIAEGGPIQGLFGTRTRLGLVTMIALISFLVEWRTRSVRPGVAVFSVALAGTMAVLTASPLVLVMAVVLGVATATLAAVRRTPPRARAAVQWVIAGVVTVAAILAYIFRQTIITRLNAEPDFLVRSRLRNALLDRVEDQPVRGWGWYGTWPDDTLPFSVIQYQTGREHASALNAPLDVLLQAGWVGFVLFATFALLALARSWITASERRSTVYTWPALILVLLLVDGLVESAILADFGWFLLVVCATKASLVRGWRSEAHLDSVPDEPALPHEQ
jgi:O-antigen ligase